MTALGAFRPCAGRHPGRLLSEILSALGDGAAERVCVGDVVGALRDRSFAPLMVLFAVPNVVLLVPGSSMLTAVPLAFLAVQLILGRADVWLPRFVAERSIERAAFQRMVRVAVPRVARIERLARPRLWPGSSLLAERAIGVATLVLALLMFLPIPFANGLPAIAIVLFALGLSERDGLWVAAGFFVSLVATAVALGMVMLGGLAVMEVLIR